MLKPFKKAPTTKSLRGLHKLQFTWTKSIHLILLSSIKHIIAQRLVMINSTVHFLLCNMFALVVANPSIVILPSEVRRAHGTKMYIYVLALQFRLCVFHASYENE
jgi:hypothetical protein